MDSLLLCSSAAPGKRSGSGPKQARRSPIKQSDRQIWQKKKQQENHMQFSRKRKIFFLFSYAGKLTAFTPSPRMKRSLSLPLFPHCYRRISIVLCRRNMEKRRRRREQRRGKDYIHEGVFGGERSDRQRACLCAFTYYVKLSYFPTSHFRPSPPFCSLTDRQPTPPRRSHLSVAFAASFS